MVAVAKSEAAEHTAKRLRIGLVHQKGKVFVLVRRFCL